MSYAALPTLGTPRLTLRPLDHLDAEAIARGVGNYDVSRWLGRVPYPYGIDDAREFIDRVQGDNLMIWAIEKVEKVDGVVGVVGLDEELGYWLARPHWRKGYGFEAAKAAVDHWFSNRGNGDLVSGHYDENDRSRRVLLALGFQVSGHSARYAKSLAQAVPGTDMILTRSRWKARQGFTLYTPRLTLRPLEKRDAAAFAKLTVPKVTRMLARLKPDMTEAQVLGDLPQRAWRGYLGFTLAIEHEGRFAGTVGVGGPPASVDCFLDPRLWGRGLMTEALSAFLPEFFDRFPISRIEADPFEDNPASGTILKKLGFVVTGHEMGTSLARVEPCRAITYALTRDNLRVPT